MGSRPSSLYHWISNGNNYRLMHAIFHIKTVIIPRDRYRPEGRYRSRDNNSPDMERGMHSSIYHIFQHWIKKNKFNFPHRHQTYGYEWSISVEGSASETPTNLSSLSVDIFQTTINSWAEVTSWGSREAWYRVIRVLPRWQISLWHFRCLRKGKIDVITYKYVIKMFSTQKDHTLSQTVMSTQTWTWPMNARN